MENKIDPIFYICNDPERALGLELNIPDFHIVCIDDNPIIDYLLQAGAKVFSLERALGSLNKVYRNSKILMEHELTQKYISENTPNGTIPHVIFFKIANNLEFLANKLGYKILNTSSKLNKKYEDKISQYENLQPLRVNFPKTIITRLEECSYENLVEELGEGFVIQYDHGHTGNSTVFIKNSFDFNEQKSKYSRKKARIAQHIKGDAWTINCVTTRYGTLYSGLCKQITGVPELTEKEGATVGNDWSQVHELSEFAIMEIKRIAETIGDFIYRDGYKGLFGLDLIINELSEVYLIEVNARQPASTGIHNKLLLKNSSIPLQLLHIAEFMFANDNEYLQFINDSLNKEMNEKQLIHEMFMLNELEKQNFNASQFILRNQGDEEIIKESAKPGIYQDNQFIREGYSIGDIINSNEYLLLATSAGKKVSNGSEISRVQQLKHFETSDILKLMISPNQRS